MSEREPPKWEPGAELQLRVCYSGLLPIPQSGGAHELQARGGSPTPRILQPWLEEGRPLEPYGWMGGPRPEVTGPARRHLNPEPRGGPGKWA